MALLMLRCCLSKQLASPKLILLDGIEARRSLSPVQSLNGLCREDPASMSLFTEHASLLGGRVYPSRYRSLGVAYSGSFEASSSLALPEDVPTPNCRKGVEQ